MKTNRREIDWQSHSNAIAHDSKVNKSKLNNIKKNDTITKTTMVPYNHSSGISNDLCKELLRYFFKSPSMIQIEGTKELIEFFGIDEVSDCFQVSAINGKNLAYVIGILRRRWLTPIDSSFYQFIVDKINGYRMLKDFHKFGIEKLKNSPDSVLYEFLEKRRNGSYIRDIVKLEEVSTIEENSGKSYQEFSFSYLYNEFTPFLLRKKFGINPKVIRTFMEPMRSGAEYNEGEWFEQSWFEQSVVGVNESYEIKFPSML